MTLPRLRTALTLIRQIIRAGAIGLVWTIAIVPMMFLPPAAGAAFIVGLSVLVVAIHVWIPRRRGDRKKLAALRARPLPSPRQWIFAALVLSPVYGGALGLVYTQLVPMNGEDLEFYTAYFEAGGGWFALALLVVVLGPMLEEFIFRGWIQGSLERKVPPSVAIMLAAFLFALMHGRAEVLPLFFIVGSLFGWAVWRSGTVWAGVLLHSGYNAGVMMIGPLSELEVVGGLLGPDMEVGVIGLGLLSILVVAGVTGIVHIGQRAGRAPMPATMPMPGSNGVGEHVWGPRTVRLSTDDMLELTRAEDPEPPLFDDNGLPVALKETSPTPPKESPRPPSAPESQGAPATDNIPSTPTR